MPLIQWISEFEASVIYRVSSSIVRAIWRNCVSQNKETKAKYVHVCGGQLLSVSGVISWIRCPSILFLDRVFYQPWACWLPGFWGLNWGSHAWVATTTFPFELLFFLMSIMKSQPDGFMRYYCNILIQFRLLLVSLTVTLYIYSKPCYNKNLSSQEELLNLALPSPARYFKTGSLCSPGCPRVLFVNQAHLHLSASLMLGLMLPLLGASPPPLIIKLIAWTLLCNLDWLWNCGSFYLQPIEC